MSKVIFTFFLLTVWLFSARSAQAYLDPGSGSFIFQLILGAILGGLVTIKLWYRKLRAAIVRLWRITGRK